MILADIYRLQVIGSPSFCNAIITAGFDMTRSEIERVSKKAATDTEFYRIYLYTDWWLDANNLFFVKGEEV